MKKLYFLALILLTVVSFGQTKDVGGPNIFLNEIDPDQSGTDSAEFIEILTDPNGSLEGFVIVLFNGSNDKSYAAYDLDGFTGDANGFFILANATHPGYNAATDIELLGLQNGADAVALYFGNATDFPDGTAITTTNLFGAIVYGTNDADDAELLAGFSQAVQYNDTTTESIQRNTDGTYETKPATFRADNSSGLPPCDLDLGDRNATCDAYTSGTDTYTVTIDFTGGATSAYVITSNMGTVAGDDPAAVATGTITITGISEGTDLIYTANNTTTGGSCDLTVNVNSPTCIPANCSAVGDIIITEIFKDATGPDDNKEWFEVLNTTGSSIDMEGWTIRDNDSDSHTIAVSFIIPANSYAVLGESNDTALNDGVTVDYVYSDFTLGNGSDEVVLECTGIIIDEVVYDGGTIFLDPQGASLELSINHLNATDNDNGAAWCEGITDIGAGNLGTPGAVNDCATTLSIPSNEIDGFSIYPNPVVDGKVVITTLNATQKNVELYSIIGKQVYTNSFTGTEIEVNFGRLNSGIYILKVNEGNNVSTSKLVVK